MISSTIDTDNFSVTATRRRLLQQNIRTQSNSTITATNFTATAKL